jgi:hypothetical protein
MTINHSIGATIMTFINHERVAIQAGILTIHGDITYK